MIVFVIYPNRKQFWPKDDSKAIVVGGQVVVFGFANPKSRVASVHAGKI